MCAVPLRRSRPIRPPASAAQLQVDALRHPRDRTTRRRDRDGACSRACQGDAPGSQGAPDAAQQPRLRHRDRYAHGTRYVEVKGTKRPLPHFYMSEGERLFADANRDHYFLLVAFSVNTTGETLGARLSSTTVLSPQMRSPCYLSNGKALCSAPRSLVNRRQRLLSTPSKAGARSVHTADSERIS